jgi:hypothetical protein
MCSVVGIPEIIVGKFISFLSCSLSTIVLLPYTSDQEENGSHRSGTNGQIIFYLVFEATTASLGGNLKSNDT